MKRMIVALSALLAVAACGATGLSVQAGTAAVGTSSRSVASAEASSVPGVVTIRSGFMQRFPLAGAPSALRPGATHETRIGPDETRPGEITVGLAPSGNAVRVAKLHVSERTARPVAFKASAIAGTIRLETQDVCGSLDGDVWITFPPRTTSAEVYGFEAVGKSCPDAGR